MTESKLISVRVPADLLELIDKDALTSRALSRSAVIVNMLQAIYESATPGSKYILLSWPLRKKGNYVLSMDFQPKSVAADELSSKNLITP